jgi:hypothetical protein
VSTGEILEENDDAAPLPGAAPVPAQEDR